MKLECTEEVVPDSSISRGPETKTFYTHPEDQREARETFYEVHSRYPIGKELSQYIASGQEAKDFFKLKNACLV